MVAKVAPQSQGAVIALFLVTTTSATLVDHEASRMQQWLVRKLCWSCNSHSEGANRPCTGLCHEDISDYESGLTAFSPKNNMLLASSIRDCVYY